MDSQETVLSERIDTPLGQFEVRTECDEGGVWTTKVTSPLPAYGTQWASMSSSLTAARLAHADAVKAVRMVLG